MSLASIRRLHKVQYEVISSEDAPICKKTGERLQKLNPTPARTQDFSLSAGGWLLCLERILFDFLIDETLPVEGRDYWTQTVLFWAIGLGVVAALFGAGWYWRNRKRAGIGTV